MVCQLFFQFTKISEDAIKMDINQILVYMRSLIENKFNPNFGLGKIC